MRKVVHHRQDGKPAVHMERRAKEIRRQEIAVHAPKTECKDVNEQARPALRAGEAWVSLQRPGGGVAADYAHGGGGIDRFRDIGCAVERLPAGGAADMALAKGGQTTLVSARRWKAATHGVEPLRDLHAAMQARGATAGVYVVTLGQLSDNARIFARDHGIVVMQADALAQMLLNAR